MLVGVLSLATTFAQEPYDTPGSALRAYRTAHGPAGDGIVELPWPPDPPPPPNKWVSLPWTPYLTEGRWWWVSLGFVPDPLPVVRHCYERGLRRDPRLTGRVVVGFEVPPSGGVSRAWIESSTLGDPAVEACVLRPFLLLRMPPPPGGTGVVRYPLVLRPAPPKASGKPPERR